MVTFYECICVCVYTQSLHQTSHKHIVPFHYYQHTSKCTNVCRLWSPMQHTPPHSCTAAPGCLFLMAGVFSDLIIALPCRYVASQVQSCWGAHHSRAFIITSATSCQASLFMCRATAVKVEDFSFWLPCAYSGVRPPELKFDLFQGSI